MNTLRIILAFLLCFSLAACGGGDHEEEPASEMPCKYRPDCTAGPPVGSEYPMTPEQEADR